MKYLFQGSYYFQSSFINKFAFSCSTLSPAIPLHITGIHRTFILYYSVQTTLSSPLTNIYGRLGTGLWWHPCPVCLEPINMPPAWEKRILKMWLNEEFWDEETVQDYVVESSQITSFLKSRGCFFAGAGGKIWYGEKSVVVLMVLKMEAGGCAG